MGFLKDKGLMGSLLTDPAPTFFVKSLLRPHKNCLLININIPVFLSQLQRKVGVLCLVLFIVFSFFLNTASRQHSE